MKCKWVSSKINYRMLQVGVFEDLLSCVASRCLRKSIIVCCKRVSSKINYHVLQVGVFEVCRIKRQVVKKILTLPFSLMQFRGGSIRGCLTPQFCNGNNRNHKA